MNQKFLKLMSVGMVCVLSVPLFASCKKDNPGDSTQTPNGDKVLVFSSGEFDKVFSPFFSTSAYDSEIHGQTQISMLGADKDAQNVTYGKDEPVVTLDYYESYDPNGRKHFRRKRRYYRISDGFKERD